MHTPLLCMHEKFSQQVLHLPCLFAKSSRELASRLKSLSPWQVKYSSGMALSSISTFTCMHNLGEDMTMVAYAQHILHFSHILIMEF